jgi:hypothetical protein
MNGTSVLDHVSYVERRMLQADDAEARLDAAVGQAARRHAAIEQAIRRIRAVDILNRQCTLTRMSLTELLEEIARGLEEANRVRATDEGNNGE